MDPMRCRYWLTICLFAVTFPTYAQSKPVTELDVVYGKAGDRELKLDLAQSWLVGDILDDIQAGKSAGCRTVLLDNGHETAWDYSTGRQPDFRVADLADAARMILSQR